MNDEIKTKKIMFSGGGSGGSVTPLLAVAEKLLAADATPAGVKLELLFVGTYTGPEQKMVAAFNPRIKFIPLISGKFRRYFSFANFLDIFKISAAFFQSFILLTRVKPAIVISAGSFVSVPLVWAAVLKKIPILIHQQDVRPGLANKLMAPYARAVTVTFENSLGDYGAKAVWTGNPLSDVEKYREEISGVKAKYELETDLPLLFITGGGTGAAALNELVLQALPLLTDFCQLIHLTGKGKLSVAMTEAAAKNSRYQVREFLPNEEVLSLMAAANVVISRCGIATLTELAALSKPAILIPMPDTHQEDNAAVFAMNNAAVVLNQIELTPEKLAAEIRNILNDAGRREKLQNNINKIIKRGATENFIGIVWEMIK
jgi:UDP-N-acetylglucosamine--N-acetylmuramyl-(pentapeptide) pyrophosphoryl-undecaprenol N-acetylglucosamine transferase